MTRDGGRITPEAVRAFHADHFGPSGATLVLAGEFASDPLAMAERHLGGWNNEGQVAVTHESARPAPRHRC